MRKEPDTQKASWAAGAGVAERGQVWTAAGNGTNAKNK